LYCSSPPIAVPSLGSTPKTADGAKQLYDEWASTYDAALESWGYPVPPRVAEVLTSLGQTDASRILDLGCGTGLSGAALRTAGLGTKGGVVGTDISNESLEISRAKGLYAQELTGTVRSERGKCPQPTGRPCFAPLVLIAAPLRTCRLSCR
jgi:predicted TPR repeat methyltransferase